MHTAHRTILIGFCLVSLAPVAGYSQVSSGSAKPATPSSAAEKQVAIIRDYASGLAGVHAANPEVKLRVDRDTAPRGELVLVVDYPAPNDNPASRATGNDRTVACHFPLSGSVCAAAPKSPAVLAHLPCTQS